MIQEIAPHKYDNTYKLYNVQDDDYIFIFDKNQVVMKKSRHKETLPKFKDFKDIQNINNNDFIYLFKIDDYKFFLFKNDENNNELFITEILREINQVNKEELFIKESIQIFRTLKPLWIAFAGFTAKHLYVWYSSNKYCSRCGHKLEIYHKERALCCKECNNIIYPSIMPAVIVGVKNKDKLLLTKYSRKGAYKKYALVAGFVEIGETVEDTVKREVMEEVGLKVKNIRYFGSQPWGLTNTILMGYFADLDGDDTVILEEDELCEGTWFKYDEIPERDSLISLTQTMINEFRNKKGNV
ncbi:MAG: NAD(+) diphosphatase [Clostridium butyricum]|nr:NAD(+) diphosphatase [Clostridium butyricum]